MSAQSTCLEHVGVVGSPWPVGCYVEYAVLCIAHHLPQQQVQGQNCVWMSWPVLKIPTVRRSEADNFGGGLGTFCWFFFNFMFIICDSRHEDLQLFWLSFQHWSWLVGKLENVVVSCNTAHIGGLCISLRHWSMCQYILWSFARVTVFICVVHQIFTLFPKFNALENTSCMGGVLFLRWWPHLSLHAWIAGPLLVLPPMGCLNNPIFSN